MSTDSLEHIATRVRISAVTGGVAGTLVGLYRGHHSVLRTSGLMSASCAMAGAACFATERIVNSVMKDTSFQGRMVSHAAGGALGGAFLGFLYQQKPLRGVVFFTPLMVLICATEGSLQEMQRQRQEDYLRETNEETRTDV